ncbi:hypothetical protein GCM10010251_93690 [Streptomyces aurantiogriseus]|uniref:Insertion element IS402-like domain-containing protein n=1 Tax=Streptomyces aurantiogriseus TaxID=66870 RepID=A0A918L044_9ACTN|nr:hypothetical protein GCM10010251_93690 [Streptomyces aurantiogriseus]
MAWRVERRGKGPDIGRPPEHDLRRIMDAILYVDRTGIPWRYLPHEFAPWETVYGHFAAWQKDGVFDQLNGLLRRLVGEAEGRDAELLRYERHHGSDSTIEERPWIMHWYTRDHFEKLATTAGLAVTAVTGPHGKPASPDATDLLHFRLQTA